MPIFPGSDLLSKSSVLEYLFQNIFIAIFNLFPSFFYCLSFIDIAMPCIVFIGVCCTYQLLMSLNTINFFYLKISFIVFFLVFIIIVFRALGLWIFDIHHYLKLKLLKIFILNAFYLFLILKYGFLEGASQRRVHFVRAKHSILILLYIYFTCPIYTWNQY